MHTLYEKMNEVSDWLWEHPELPLMEYESSKYLREWLLEEEFVVEENFCQMPTAFKAVYGSGYPNIGILAEYDALPGLSNDCTGHRKSLGQRAGHGCLHNHIAAANIGAAIAVKNSMNENKEKMTGSVGTITVIGCPAEEIILGKIALCTRNGFEGIDILLTSHADYQNAAASRPTLASLGTEFAFYGEAGHTGIARKSNALSAVELFVQMVEKVRNNQFSGVRCEHVIRNGGIAPNINTDRASIWFSLRAENYDEMIGAYRQIQKIADNSATLEGVSVQEGFIAATRGYLPNDTLANVLFAQMKNEGLPKEGCFAPQLLQKGMEDYSQDDGDISYQIPLGRINWAMPLQIPLHTWAATSYAGMSAAKEGMQMAGRVLTKSIQYLQHHTEIIEEAKKELERRNENCIVEEPKWGESNIFFTSPESFWDDTWI